MKYALNMEYLWMRASFLIIKLSQLWRAFKTIETIKIDNNKNIEELLWNALNVKIICLNILLSH